MPESQSVAWSTQSDQEIVQLCLRGDQDAWRALLERYSRLIYAIAHRRGVGPDMAEEVFQSVVATLAERLHLIEDPQRLPKWLIVTTARRCRELRMAQRRALDPPAEAVESTDEPESVEATLLREEARRQVTAALARLGDRDREILSDLFVHNLSYAEVAERHQLAIGSLGSLRARSLRRLRKLLEEDGSL